MGFFGYFLITKYVYSVHRVQWIVGRSVSGRGDRGKHRSPTKARNPLWSWWGWQWPWPAQDGVAPSRSFCQYYSKDTKAKLRWSAFVIDARTVSKLPSNKATIGHGHKLLPSKYTEANAHPEWAHDDKRQKCVWLWAWMLCRRPWNESWSWFNKGHAFQIGLLWIAHHTDLTSVKHFYDLRPKRGLAKQYNIHVCHMKTEDLKVRKIESIEAVLLSLKNLDHYQCYHQKRPLSACVMSNDRWGTRMQMSAAHRPMVTSAKNMLDQSASMSHCRS